MNLQDVSGLISIRTSKTPDDLFEHVLDTLRNKQITVFATVDHSGNAAEVGMVMPFSKLVFFGDPRAGTPLMQQVPTVAIDLPLKFLIWQDAAGQTWLSYNDPEYLRGRHGIDESLVASLAGIRKLAEIVTA